MQQATELLELQVWGMVGTRCIDQVTRELDRLGIAVTNVHLDTVTLRQPLGEDELAEINRRLVQRGFSIGPAAGSSVHQRTKHILNEFFSQDDVSGSTANLSLQIQDALGLDYETIDQQFARVEGKTLARYIIDRRLGKAREWLVYSDETLPIIADRTGFGSARSLTSQFKQQTGLSPSFFRAIRYQKQALVAQSQPAV